MRNCREIMQRSKALLLIFAMAGILAGCHSKRQMPTPLTLTFDANGGALAQETGAQPIAPGEKAQRPADPTRTGYDFVGWVISQNGTSLFDFDAEAITADLTLYARWAIKTYTIAFDANGGSPTPPPQQVSYGSQVAPPANPTPENTSLAFVGWTDTLDGADRFDFSRPITDALTLYAKWNPVYTVTFDANGGTLAAGTDPQQVVSGEKATPPDEPTLTGRLFLGWTKTQDGTDTFDLATEAVTEPLTLYAKWVASLTIYPLTLNANGGTISGATTTRQFPFGSVLPTPIRARNGRRDFTFLYWSEDKRTSFDFNTPEKATTLYAMWGVAIPDAVFRNKLKALLPSAFNGDQLVISHPSVTELTSMDVSSAMNATARINDLSGIEFFTALASLTCNNNDLGRTTLPLDLSQNTALRSLTLANNNLRTLDLSRNTALTTLTCHGNLLSALDLRSNLALTYLDCSENVLRNLDVRQNPALTQLVCDRNNLLDTLDLSRNTALTWLICNNTSLQTLDLSRNTRLTQVNCSYTKIRTLDVRSSTALTYLDCSFSDLTGTLDVSGATALTKLSCNNNKLNSLDVSGATALPELDCSNNQLSSLNVSGATALTRLICNNNFILSLDVSKNTALTYLDCTTNRQLTSLNVSGATALTKLLCADNQLTSLDVSSATALTELNCSLNRLTSLNVSGATALARLYCNNNNLRTLDLSRNTALTALNCSDNRLTRLNVSGATALSLLWCANNQLTGTGLDVGQNPDLTQLICNNNQLTGLNLNRNSRLTELDCSYNNSLTSLTVGGGALTKLSCNNNSLRTLDVSQNTRLTELVCSANPFTGGLDVSKNTALTKLLCSANELTSLDVKQNIALTELVCTQNKLTSLDLSQNIALTTLNCADNDDLTTLDIRGMRSVASTSSLKIPERKTIIFNLNLKVHTNLKDNPEVYKAKSINGVIVYLGFFIEVYDAPAGSTDDYTKTCSDYEPGNGTAGRCLRQ